MDYLGHTITRAGVAMDKQKVAAVQEWPVALNLKPLTGILASLAITGGSSKGMLH